MKKVFFMVLFGLSATVLFAQPADIESLRPQINQYLSLAAADNIEKYGFRNSDDLSLVQFGEPIQSVEMESGFYEDGNATGIYCMQDLDEYRIPLITNDTIRAFAIVVPQNGQWIVVDFGASGLAKRVDECYRSCNVKKHQRVKMLRDPFSGTDYVELSENDYVTLELRAKDEQSFKPKHHSKDEIKNELHKQYESNVNAEKNNHKNNNHGKH